MNATGHSRMRLGIFAYHGVVPLEFKPAYSLGDLLLQHLDALEQEAEEKGGVQQVLANHFAKVYKVSLQLRLMEIYSTVFSLSKPSQHPLCQDHIFGQRVAPQDAGLIRYTEVNPCPPTRDNGTPDQQKELYGFTPART